MIARLARHLILISLTTTAGASGQTIGIEALPSPLDGDDEIGWIEVLPPEVQVDVDKAHALLQVNGALGIGKNRDKNFSVISELFLQIPNRPVTVCFKGISTDLRRRIEGAARGWEFPKSSLRFDFGAEYKLRDCVKGVPSDIRISSNGPGTWSLIGREADLTRTSDAQTMNFSSSTSWSTMDMAKFRRIVQHEFGHAIGLYHEHQNPNASCVNQLRWDLIKATFSNLSEEYLRANFTAQISPAVKPYATTFDDKSIMMYDLPANVLKDGASSSCFRVVNMEISRDDRAMIEQKYAIDAKKAQSKRLAAYKFLVKAVRDPTISELSRENLQLAVGALYPFHSVAAKEGYLSSARDYIKQQ